ncbi:MAG: hypothetical protein QN123_12465, partial [Armatimonadota bacterium]|nr:hypothetical protein [Armatimonadota bacterium]
EAYANARLQLDFASVTAHAAWPDMPEATGPLAPTIEYHRRGFEAAAKGWPHLLQVTREVTEEGRFVAFPSFEWHSLRYGDHNVYYRDADGEIVRGPTLKALREALREIASRGTLCYLIPHHIGYPRGYRGLDWSHFTGEFSPVVEIFSLHGAAEDDDAPYPYLHTMGPRESRSTMRWGLTQGYVFGVIGSTDHHAAHPGSYGHGRAAVWARSLTRADIWEAIGARRTCALTGDRIAVALAVNGRPMGAILPWSRDRQIDVAVVGGAPLDMVEVVHNGRPLHRWSPAGSTGAAIGPHKVTLEVGWGDRAEIVDWQVELAVEGGRFLSVEPRVRGPETVSPIPMRSTSGVTATCTQPEAGRVLFSARTCGNPTLTTTATQGLCLEIDGTPAARLVGRINGRPVDVTLAELREGSRVGYLEGFRSAAYRFSRAAAYAEYSGTFSIRHRGVPGRRDWYYVRVRQVNDQWAWTSPIWVAGG